MGCRQRAEKSGLLRVVRSPDGAVHVDLADGSSGRGAYVHPRPECATLAAARGSLGRSLRVTLDGAGTASLMREIEEALER